MKVRRATRGLAAETDVSFLKEAQLVQICVGRHDVILNLIRPDPYDPPISISIESSVRLVSPGGEELTSEESPQVAQTVLPLLGSTVADVAVLPPGTLRLTWSSDYVLDVVDSVTRYESYSITSGDQVIVV